MSKIAPRSGGGVSGSGDGGSGPLSGRGGGFNPPTPPIVPIVLTVIGLAVAGTIRFLPSILDGIGSLFSAPRFSPPEPSAGTNTGFEKRVRFDDQTMKLIERLENEAKEAEAKVAEYRSNPGFETIDSSVSQFRNFLGDSIGAKLAALGRKKNLDTQTIDSVKSSLLNYFIRIVGSENIGKLKDPKAIERAILASMKSEKPESKLEYHFDVNKLVITINYERAGKKGSLEIPLKYWAKQVAIWYAIYNGLPTQ